MLNKIIVFTSEYGSGARLIGRTLAEMLNVKFYGEEELLIEAAKEEGITEEMLREYDRKLKKSIKDINIYNSIEHEEVYKAYSKAILRIIEKGPCILMERGADIVLKDKIKFLNVYGYSNCIEKKLKRCEIVDGYQKEEAFSVIEAENTIRKNYYNLFSKIERGQPKEYDICINTDAFNDNVLNMEKCAAIIKAAL